MGDAWVQFRSAYYLYAIIFLIFDVEAVFLLPFAVAFTGLGIGACAAMLVFVLLLAEGLGLGMGQGHPDLGLEAGNLEQGIGNKQKGSNGG